MLFDREYILDRIAAHRAQYEARREEAFRAGGKTAVRMPPFETHLKFRRFIFPATGEIDFNNDHLVNMLFHQLVAEVEKGYHRCTLEESAILAATLIRVKNIDADLDRKRTEAYVHEEGKW